MGRRGERTAQAVPGDRGDRHGFPALVEEFCTDLGARGYADATIRARRQALAQLAGWLADRGVSRPVQVTRPMLVRYQRHLFHYRKPDGQPLSFRSQNARLLPVRAFFKWAVRAEHIGSNPASELELPKVEHRLPKPALTIAEAEQVLAGPDLATTAGLRDRAMLETFYGTGIRRAELARRNLRDLDAQRATLMVRQGKGRKDRMIPIGPRAIAWISKYLTDARPDLAAGSRTGSGGDGPLDDGTLFLTVDGTPFSLDRLTQLVRGYVKAAGVGKEGACHLFRHTLATLMLEGGADIRYIQAMLGHAELSTTQIYTQVSIRALQAVHTATFPGAVNVPPAARNVSPGEGNVPPTFPPTTSTTVPEATTVPGAMTGLGPVGKVSAHQLLAVLDLEIEEENRAHPGPDDR